LDRWSGQRRRCLLRRAARAAARRPHRLAGAHPRTRATRWGGIADDAPAWRIGRTAIAGITGSATHSCSLPHSGDVVALLGDAPAGDDVAAQQIGFGTVIDSGMSAARPAGPWRSPAPVLPQRAARPGAGPSPTGRSRCAEVVLRVSVSEFGGSGPSGVPVQVTPGTPIRPVSARVTPRRRGRRSPRTTRPGGSSTRATSTCSPTAPCPPRPKLPRSCTGPGCSRSSTLA